MNDLRYAVEHLQGAGNKTFGADRQQLFDIAGLGAKIGQHHVAGVVAGIDQMRRARVAPRRRTMPVDGHLQRHHGSRHRLADFWPRPAIDHARRQMQQQIDQPRRLIAAEQVAKQFVLLRPDASKAGDRYKQGIEQGRAHYRYLVAYNPSCAGLTRASIHLQETMDCRVKPTVVWHGPCLSCRVLRGEVSANIAAPSRGAGCMWSEVKSGLLWLGGWRSLEKFADRAPMHQVGADEPGEGERAFYDLVGVVSQPQQQEGD